jgi:hypothetical protein
MKDHSKQRPSYDELHRRVPELEARLLEVEQELNAHGAEIDYQTKRADEAEKALRKIADHPDFQFTSIHHVARAALADTPSSWSEWMLARYEKALEAEMCHDQRAVRNMNPNFELPPRCGECPPCQARAALADTEEANMDRPIPRFPNDPPKPDTEEASE